MFVLGLNLFNNNEQKVAQCIPHIVKSCYLGNLVVKYARLQKANIHFLIEVYKIFKT